MMWRDAMYRLMAVTRSGHVYVKVDGTLPYLFLIGSRAKTSRGRQWIDRTDFPAVLA